MRVRLLFLLTTLGLVALPTATAAARSNQRVLFEAPRELRSDDAALRTGTLDEIKSLGVHWLRIVMYFNDVAPNRDGTHIPTGDEADPGFYDWTRYDRMLQEADARGFRILLTISGPVPRWATKRRTDHVTRPSPTRFGRFAEAVAKRYGAIVDAYSIWNEPNHPGFLKPQWTGKGRHRDATSARLYRELYRSAHRGLKRGGSGRAPILIGETAPRGTGHVVHPIIFLRRALCLNARWHMRRSCHKLDADGWAHHAYTTRRGPYFVPPSANDVTIGVLGRLNSALAKAARAGAIRKGMPIWLTEFGIQSFPDHLMGVSEHTQAEYLAISERIAQHNKRVVAFSQYLMRDDDPRQDAESKLSRYGGFESGLRHSDGEPKVAYDAFPIPLAALEGRKRTTLWGIVRRADGRTAVKIDYRNRGSSRWHYLKRDHTNRYGVWSTTTSKRRGRRYRVRWTAPDGTRLTGPLTRAHRRP